MNKYRCDPVLALAYETLNWWLSEHAKFDLLQPHYLDAVKEIDELTAWIDGYTAGANATWWHDA